MESIEDPFPSSLPSYDSPVHVFDRDAAMTEAVDDAFSSLESPDAFFGEMVNNYSPPLGTKSSPQPPSMLATASGPSLSQSHSPESSMQGSSSDSQRNSTIGSDSSGSGSNGGDVNMTENDTPVANGIVIGADPTDDENNLFDFPSAASGLSVADPNRAYKTSNANSITVPFRSFHNGLSNGVGPYAGASKSSRKASPWSGLKKIEQSWPMSTSQPSPELGRQFISPGSILKEPAWPLDPLATDLDQSSLYQKPTLPVHYATEIAQKHQGSSRLYIDRLPHKSRVETQISVKLTLAPFPQGINRLHLQTYTISKSKFVAKPTPEKAADMLELYATLTCTSAMQDPGKRSLALSRAADRPASPTVDEDKALDVRICQGCIERERKRAARKKTKKVEEEELWQKDEAKRIIVFNTSEIKEWQPPSMQTNGKVANPGVGDSATRSCESAMQVDMPMRIACYCRHQDEKTGFQVIFTIKDSCGNLVAQELSSSITITDDHKTHGAPTTINSQNPLLSEQHQLTGSGFYPQGLGLGNTQGYPPITNRAFSTNDLVGMQNYYGPQIAMQSSPFANPQHSSQTTSATLTPRNLSRQASPSGPSSTLQNKRRKGSASGSRMRNNLVMTRLQTTTPPHPSHMSSSSSGQAFPFSPNYAPPHGLPMPSVNSHFSTNPPTPTNTDSSFFSSAPRSQSMENLQNFPGMFSAPTSVRPSRAPSPTSAAISNALPQAHAQSMTNSLHAVPDPTNQRTMPVIHKLTPAEGPRSGGIEVTCLGAGFRKDLEVVFGDALATTTTYWGESALVCLVPPAVQAGTVPVTFKHNHHQNYPSPPTRHVYFRYIDDDEPELIRHALTILDRQFSNQPMGAGDFARQVLAHDNQSFQGGSTHTLNHHLQLTALNDHAEGLVDVQAVILRCLEVLDLDDAPYQMGLNVRGHNGQGMLHLSASMGYYRLVCGLLARGAHPDLRDHNGLSPLHMACIHGRQAIIRKLRSAGADPTLRSLNGYTPTDMATSNQARDAINIFDHHARSRSIEASSTSHFSRTNSQQSVNSFRDMKPRSVSDGMGKRPMKIDKSEEEHFNAPKSQSMTPSQMWARSRRNSLIAVDSISKQAHADTLTSDTSGFVSSPAMSAWRDQLSTQIQQLQQSVHRALPPIPALPDYQAYPVVRRISSLVPQRSLRSGSSNDTGGTKDADYRWWELLTGVASSPPPYEEIYPQQMAEKKLATLHAAGETLMDRKCEALYDQPERSSQVNIISHLEQSKTSHAQKVKRLRSDRNLFFIWIPLLVLVVVAMLKDRVPCLWYAARHRLSYHDRVEVLDGS